MTKPDDSGISVIIGTILLVSAFSVMRINPEAPAWFLLLLACCGNWLVSYPLFSRHLISKTLIQAGEDPEYVKQKFQISLGFMKI